jgi:hypothetical protein
LFAWRDLDEADVSRKPMIFWTKQL